MRNESGATWVRLPLQRLGPGACFAVTLGYLALLGAFAVLYGAELLPLDDSGRAYVAVIAWFAALGGAMASLHDIFRDMTKWNPAANLAYLIRPVTGAIFGSVSYFIYIVLAQASLVGVEAESPDRPSVLSLMIAFALGYREEIFRRLLQRVIDLLATAGGADTEPPSAPRDVTCTVTKSNGVEVTWTAASDNVAVVGYNVYRDYQFLTAIRVAGEPPADLAGTSQPPSGQMRRVLERWRPSVGAGGGPGEAGASQTRPPHRLRFLDNTPVPPQHLYSVTAVDGAGNESEPVGPFVVVIATSTDRPPAG